MTTTETIRQADQIVEAIAGRGNVVRTEEGTYIFLESRQEVSAPAIIAGAGQWATETLDNMQTPAEDVVVASLILIGHFDHASDLIKFTAPEIGKKIQYHIGAVAARYA